MLKNRISFCFCLPRTREKFELSAIAPEFDFARHFIRTHETQGETDFEFYQREILRPYHMLKKTYASYGIEFCEDFRFEQVQECAKDAKDVLLLFSHCISRPEDCFEQIEFSNGMFAWDQILVKIPTSFAGVVDLSVCKPDILAHELKIRRPQCVVKSSKRSIQLVYWLYFYSELFHDVIVHQLDYIDALTFTYLRLNNQYEQKTK
jgi:hypothetical protein